MREKIAIATQHLRETVSKIKQQLAPLSNRWKTYKATHPKRALALASVFFSGLIGFLFVVTFCTLVYSGTFGKLPSYSDLKRIQNNVASEVYSEDGVLLGKYFIENRVNADFEEISPNIINALIATEDARFFEHSGIDFRAWVRVFFKTILMMDDSGGGGSTLSQQLAKNLYKREQFKLMTVPITKVKEMFIARRLERTYNKNELLNLYLNTVPFGSSIYGVKVASQRFFNTSPAEITIEDAAVLVGMLKANTRYNPHKNPELSMRRRNTVLGQMVKYGHLETNIFDSLKTQKIQSYYYKEGSNQGLATYFREHLRLELADVLKDFKKPNGETYNIYTDGLKIYTTLDARMQRYSEEAVLEQMVKLQEDFNSHWKGRKGYGGDNLLKNAKERSTRYKRLKKRRLNEETIAQNFETPVSMTIFDWKNRGEKDTLMSPNDSLKYYLSMLNTGFLAAEPQTGRILAWVGGIDHKYFHYDHVKSQRQVGSVFKPLVYTQALRQNTPPCDYIDNLLINYTQYENWTPKNSDGKYGGIYSMEGALSHSVNSSTVDLMLRTGIDSVKVLAENMGISSEIPSVPAISLGTINASLWEMVRVYSTFANQGRKPELHYLKRIETADGKILVNFEAPKSEDFPEIFPDSIAQIMTQMLRSVVDSGTAKRLRYQYGLYNQIAGKTGTTQNHSDGWFLGYTPNLVAGAWVGGTAPTVRFRSMRLGQGSKTALPIFGRFLSKVYKDDQFKQWKKQRFSKLDSLTLAALDCPPFLEDRSMIPSLHEDGLENEGFFNWVEQIFVTDKEEKTRRQRNHNRQKSKASEKIERNNRKMEEKRRKKKKRKKIFN